MWRLDQKIIDGGYCMIETNEGTQGLPTTDTRAHTLNTKCPCKPDSVFTGQHMHIIHKRFEDEDKINDSIKKLFG